MVILWSLIVAHSHCISIFAVPFVFVLRINGIGTRWKTEQEALVTSCACTVECRKMFNPPPHKYRFLMEPSSFQLKTGVFKGWHKHSFVLRDLPHNQWPCDRNIFLTLLCRFHLKMLFVTSRPKELNRILFDSGKVEHSLRFSFCVLSNENIDEFDLRKMFSCKMLENISLKLQWISSFRTMHKVRQMSFYLPEELNYFFNYYWSLLPHGNSRTDDFSYAELGEG